MFEWDSYSFETCNVILGAIYCGQCRVIAYVFFIQQVSEKLENYCCLGSDKCGISFLWGL